MHLYMQAYDEILGNLLERMDGIFSELPVEALDWTPDPAMNSITVLVVHTTGTLRYWVDSRVGKLLIAIARRSFPRTDCPRCSFIPC